MSIICHFSTSLGWGGGGERAWCSTLIMNVVCVYTLGLGGRGGGGELPEITTFEESWLRHEWKQASQDGGHAYPKGERDIYSADDKLK